MVPFSRAMGVRLEETWGLIFDPAKQPGPFMLLDDPRFGIGPALWFKGHSVNSVDPNALGEARQLLLESKRRSLGFISSIAGRNRVLSKELMVSVASSSDAIHGEKEDSETYYFVPREGGALWLDTLSIPAKAPHRDLAEKFINFLLEPKVAAQFSNFSQLATPNKAALEFINPEDRKNPALYPPPEVMRRLEYVNDLGDQNKLYDELWTQIKSK